MYQLSNLVNLLNANWEITNEITQGGITETTAPWLYIVSTALSDPDTDAFSYHQRDYDELFAFDFHLTPAICDHLRNAIEHVWGNRCISYDLYSIDTLYYQLNKIKMSWRECRNNFEQHMHYISHLAAEVMYLHNMYETDINESGRELFGEDAMQYSLLLRFESQIIQPLRYNLTTAAYEIINRSN